MVRLWYNKNMKKVDLHIHTLPSVSDHDFEFSENKLLEYIKSAKVTCKDAFEKYSKSE